MARRKRPKRRVGRKYLQRVQGSIVMVVGVGMLGGHVVRELAQLGVTLILVDPDVVEARNLGNQYFEVADIGCPKVEARARAAAACNPECRVVVIQARAEDVGLGVFREADVIVTALDNRSARVRVGEIGQQVARPVLDLSVDGSGAHRFGTITLFDPRHAEAPCYACRYDADELAAIRTENRPAGCVSWRSREVPATPPTLASPPFGAALAGLATTQLIDVLLDRGFAHANRVTQLAADGPVAAKTVALQRSAHCRYPHRALTPLRYAAADTIAVLFQRAERELGEKLERFQLYGREFVHVLQCLGCEEQRSLPRLAHAYTGEELQCGCDSSRNDGFIPSESFDHLERQEALRLRAMTWRALGLPAGDVVTAVGASGRELSYVVGRHLSWLRRGERPLSRGRRTPSLTPAPTLTPTPTPTPDGGPTP